MTDQYKVINYLSIGALVTLKDRLTQISRSRFCRICRIYKYLHSIGLVTKKTLSTTWFVGYSI